MRINIGKKVGSMYVSTSLGGRKRGSWAGCFGSVFILLWYAIKWIFVGLYYITIWPFVKLYRYYFKPGEKTPAWQLVILWILFWPIMGIAAIIKSSMHVGIKVGIIAAAVLVLLLIGVLYDGDSDSQDPDVPAGVIAASPSPDGTDATPGAADTPAPTQRATTAPAELPTPEPTATPTKQPTPTPEPTPEPVLGYVDANELNLRASASTDSDILMVCTRGQEVEILGEDGDWLQVGIGGVVGYMMAEYIDDEKPDSEPVRTEAPDSTPAPATPAPATPAPATPAPATPAPATPEPTAAPRPNIYYIGNKNNKKLHQSDCDTLPNPENQVHFNTKDEAVAAGYNDPCQNCMR